MEAQLAEARKGKQSLFRRFRTNAELRKENKQLQKELTRHRRVDRVSRGAAGIAAKFIAGRELRQSFRSWFLAAREAEGPRDFLGQESADLGTAITRRAIRVGIWGVLLATVPSLLTGGITGGFLFWQNRLMTAQLDQQTNDATIARRAELLDIIYREECVEANPSKETELAQRSEGDSAGEAEALQKPSVSTPQKICTPVAHPRARQEAAIAFVKIENSREETVNLNTAKIPGTDLVEAKLSGAILSGANLKEARLRKADLTEADLREADLREAILRGAILSNANLSGAILNGADLDGANLKEAKLPGADLGRANLIRANLREADLSGTNLREADLGWADLRETYLIGTNLREADLTRANLRKANLTRANLRKASLSGAILSGAYLRGADLREASLSEADLTRAFLSWADLSRANLRGADLTEADLREADLREAILSGAELSGTDLREAILSGAELSGTDLSRARNLTQGKIRWAFSNSETRLPEGFVRPNHWIFPIHDQRFYLENLPDKSAD
ncbi:MAG: pentapeptide repeat-containing protein [Deltaproteobacteria bacterium]|nr:pentapeptide repeat-containing protein [Deltaproteobacteria bacterium]